MNVKFIGTGSGLTDLDRFHSSILVASSNHNLLIDCGDGISRALIKQGIDFGLIDSILISHFHSDHFAGLPSLLTQMKLNKRSKGLKIYVHSSEIKFLNEFLQHSYLFLERFEFKIEVIPFDIEIKIYPDEGFYFISKSNTHLHKYKNNLSTVEKKFVSLSFLLADKNNSVIYSGDIGCADDLFLFDEKADWFITETTHINPEDIFTLVQNTFSKQIIITHLDKETLEKIQSVLNQIYQSGGRDKILIAYDGFELNQYHSGCL